jgi:hypothetical protein
MPWLGGPRRRAAALALVVAVIVLHALVTRHVLQSMAEFATPTAMPPRIQVTYVRELELAPPPDVAPVVVAPKPPRSRSAAPAAAPAVAQAASAAEPVPASVPEPLPPLPAEATPAPPAAVPQATPASDAFMDAVAGAEAFDWPLSTRLTYELTGNYRGDLHGDAQVEWVRAGNHYQVNIDISLGPLISRRMSSQGDLIGDRLLPSRYDEETRVVLRQPRRVTILFNADEVVLATGERQERGPGVQDSASQFIQLAATLTTHPELRHAGATLDMPLALRNRVGSWVYEVLGEEDVKTPFGSVATYHLKPRNVVSGGNELSAEVWFAPQLRFLPVRIKIQQDAYTFVDLVIARRPEIAAQ